GPGNLYGPVAIRGCFYFCRAHERRHRQDDRGRGEGTKIMTTIAPFGSWKSPISSELLTSSGIGFSELHFSNGNLYWLESRPDEAGRVVVVCCPVQGTPSDAIPEGFNARSRVHEYGGGAYFVHDGAVFFSNFKDQRLYREETSGTARVLTSDPS